MHGREEMAGARKRRTRSSAVGGGVPSSGDAGSGSGSSRGGWHAQQSIVDEIQSLIVLNVVDPVLCCGN